MFAAVATECSFLHGCWQYCTSGGNPPALMLLGDNGSRLEPPSTSP